MENTAAAQVGSTQSIGDILRYGLGRWIDGEYQRRYTVVDPTPQYRPPGNGGAASPQGQPAQTNVVQSALQNPTALVVGAAAVLLLALLLRK